MAKLIFKKANKYNMFLIEDATHKYWDNTSRKHKLIIKFIQLERNNTKKIIRTFVDVEEFRNILTIIKDSKFENIFKSEKGTSKKFFGGSRSGLALERTSEGSLKPIIKGMEARILTFDRKTKENIPFYRVSAAVSDGRKGRNGTIVFTNQNRSQLYYDFSLEDINLMAVTVLEYLKARQNIALNHYFNPENKAKYIKTIKLLRKKVGKEKYSKVLKQNYIQKSPLEWNIEDYKVIISSLKKMA